MASGGKGEKRPKRKDKRKHKRKRRKSITFESILGSVPAWVLWILLSGVALFLGLNGYLALSLASTNNNPSNSMPVTFLRRMWDKSHTRLTQTTETIFGTSKEESRCPSYGCAVVPLEYMDEEVQRALKVIKSGTADAKDSESPFGSWEIAALTRKSNRKHPPFNQDAAVIIKPYQTAQTTQDSDFFIGIFDGHGEDGHINAHYFVQDVPRRLAQYLNSQSKKRSTKEIVQYLKDTFVESDKLAPKNITLRGGCTASVTVRIGNQLFFANAGDSRTVLVSVKATQFRIVEAGPAPGVTQLYITRADKPHLPEEKARIEAAGGKVHIPPKNPNLSRVIVHSDEFNDTIGLAMSRSLGDYEWTVKGVIPEPLVDVVNLDDFRNLTQDLSTSLFLIAASDGLWDLRLKQWYCKQFAESFLKGNDNRKIHPLAKLQNVIKFVSPKNEAWYRDDITAITMQLI